MRPRNLLWVCIAVFVGGIAVCIGLALIAPVDDTTNKVVVHEVPKPHIEQVRLPPKVELKLPTRRLPVAGAEGFFVVVEPDGSSYLESPDGKRERLADAGEPVVPDEAVVKKVVERVQPKKVRIGQLIVCDQGVVDVPTDSIITFVGADKVVTLNGDGSSTVYHTDGKVERRDRIEKKKP